MKFGEVIKGWKRIDTLYMGPPSTKEHVGNVDDFESIKEGIKFNIDTKYRTRKEIIIHGYSHPHGTIISGIRDSTT